MMFPARPFVHGKNTSSVYGYGYRFAVYVYGEPIGMGIEGIRLRTAFVAPWTPRLSPGGYGGQARMW